MGRMGRPTKFSDEVADRIVEAVAGGASLTAAARAVGIAPRTLIYWRARAWSSRPADRPYVALERRLLGVLSAPPPPPPRPPEPPVGDWQQAAASLELQFPARWGLPGLDA